MDMNFEKEDSNVDHFLISTRENQFLLIFVDQSTMIVKKCPTDGKINILDEA